MKERFDNVWYGVVILCSTTFRYVAMGAKVAWLKFSYLCWLLLSKAIGGLHFMWFRFGVHVKEYFSFSVATTIITTMSVAQIVTYSPEMSAFMATLGGAPHLMYPRGELMSVEDYERCGAVTREEVATSVPDGLLVIVAEYPTGIVLAGYGHAVAHGLLCSSHLLAGDKSIAAHQIVGAKVSVFKADLTLKPNAQRAVIERSYHYLAPAHSTKDHRIGRDFGFLKIKDVGSKLGVSTKSLQFDFGVSDALFSYCYRWSPERSQYLMHIQLGSFVDEAVKGAWHHTVSTQPGDSAPLFNTKGAICGVKNGVHRYWNGSEYEWKAVAVIARQILNFMLVLKVLDNKRGGFIDSVDTHGIKLLGQDSDQAPLVDYEEHAGRGRKRAANLATAVKATRVFGHQNDNTGDTEGDGRKRADADDYWDLREQRLQEEAERWHEMQDRAEDEAMREWGRVWHWRRL